MAGTGLADAVAFEVSGEGSRQFQEFNEQTRQRYANELLKIRNELNQQYVIEDRLERIDTLKERYEKEIIAKITDAELKESLHIEPSGKGGADILSNNKQVSLATLAEKYNLYNKYKDIRKQTFQLKKNNDLIKIGLQAMEKISALRQDILQLKVEEHIGITFAEGDYQKLIVIPMSKYLQYAQKNVSTLFNLGMEGLTRSPFKDIHNISMKRTSTVIESLKKIEGKQETNLYFRNSSNTLETLFYKPQNDDIFLTDQINQNTLRTDKNYKVIKRGFLREAIVEAMFKEDGEMKYEEDAAPWFGKSDIEANNKIEISMKDFLSSSPTLIRFNSIFSTIDILLQALWAPIDYTQITNFLRDEVFTANKRLDDEAIYDKIIDKLWNSK